MHTVYLKHTLLCCVSQIKDMDLCETFDTFGDCNCDEQERKSHHIWRNDLHHDYFAAIIGTSRAEVVDIMRWRKSRGMFERYFIPSGGWYMKGAEKGDLVIFQASGKDMPHHLSKYGRVIYVLRQNAHDFLEEVLVEPLKEGALTIDPPGCKIRNNAITIEKCKEHWNGCKKIGIHITAVALEQPSKCTRLPCYMSSQFLFSSRKKNWSLDQGRTVMAISIYVHTMNGKVHGPAFTPIRIERNYSFGDEGLTDTFDELWSHFLGENAPRRTLLRSVLHQYIFDYPKEWEMLVLFDEIMAAFTSEVTKYVRTMKNVNFITKPSSVAPPKFDSKENVCVFEDFLTNAKQSLGGGNKTDDMALLELAAAGKVSQTIRLRDFKYLPKKYQTDVEMSSVLHTDSVVKCTSPLQYFYHFVNQQILISCMTGASREVYSRDELLGLLVIRFRTPVLRRPYINDITDRSLHFAYPEAWNGIPKLICQLRFQDFGDDGIRFHSDKVDILLKNVFCKSEDFCNRRMVRLNGAKFEEFTTAFEGHETTSSIEKMRKSFTEMAATTTAEITPYQTAGKYTLLCLHKGVELQIQVSEADAENNIDMGIRLLRVGKNCHVCFTHLHHPDKAFMSDRSDIRELITSNTIKAFKNVKLEEKLNSTKLYNVTITWNGEYGAGGSFTTDAKTAVGDSLCIRKEITRNAEVYIWTCHAVVSAFQDAILNFSICTLSQEDSRQHTEGFCVEIISRPLEEELRE